MHTKSKIQTHKNATNKRTTLDIYTVLSHTGGARNRKPSKYTGHKQPGLHGSKSFGAFWGVNTKQADRHFYGSPQPSLGGDSNLLRNGAGNTQRAAAAAAAENEDRRRHSPSATAEPNHLPADRNSPVTRCRLGSGRRAGAGESAGVSTPDMEVVPAVKGNVELTPVRGISRVWAG